MDLLDKRNCYIVPEILYVFLPGLYLSQIFIFDVRKSLNTKEGGNVQIHNWCNVKIFVFQLLFFLAGIFTIGISPSQKQTRLVISKIRLVSLQWIPRIIKKESELEKKIRFLLSEWDSFDSRHRHSKYLHNCLVYSRIDTVRLAGSSQFSPEGLGSAGGDGSDSSLLVTYLTHNNNREERGERSSIIICCQPCRRRKEIVKA